jgi:hypothetical protein
MPGPIQIDPDQREQTQRELLAFYAPEIDVDEFIAKNPILIRDRGTRTSGCLGTVLLLVGVGAGLIAVSQLLAA